MNRRSFLKSAALLVSSLAVPLPKGKKPFVPILFKRDPRGPINPYFYQGRTLYPNTEYMRAPFEINFVVAKDGYQIREAFPMRFRCQEDAEHYLKLYGAGTSLIPKLKKKSSVLEAEHC